MWLGAVNTGDKWYWKRWQDGTLKPMTFSDWNNAGSEYTAAVFGIVHSRWDQVSDSGSYKALCEKEEGVDTGKSVRAWISC